jgi:hypothetical protein
MEVIDRGAESESTTTSFPWTAIYTVTTGRLNTALPETRYSSTKVTCEHHPRLSQLSTASMSAILATAVGLRFIVSVASLFFLGVWGPALVSILLLP